MATRQLQDILDDIVHERSMEVSGTSAHGQDLAEEVILDQMLAAAKEKIATVKETIHKENNPKDKRKALIEALVYL